ncbi:MAG: carboxypeptidase-like regulatory domain-containing protein [Prevotella sp.]|nr:carboxypeptidase-like regulatory domain-containing protein [Prevotella sp.]
MKRFCQLMLVFWLCSLCALAQGDDVWTLSGKVTDAKTRKPMAHVSVTDRSVGTVTNEAGEFVLKLPSAPETVTFSCLGYKTQKLSAKALGSVRVEVRLEPSSVMLDEIVVQGADAKELVRKAMAKIVDNYPNVPNLLRGFYRETVDKRGHFTCISEGVVDVYKTGYDKNDWRDGVAIIKGRRLLSQRPGDTLSVKLQGGPVLPIILDVVKESEVLLNEEELNNYSFRYVTMSKADDRNQYVVEITPLLVVPYALYHGRLYIDQETLAFTRIELSLDMRDTDKVTQMILKKKPTGLRFTPHELSIYIDYKTDNGITRINYIRNVIRFRCDWKRKLFKSNFMVTSEMVVTDRQEGKDLKPIKSRDTFNRKDNFYDKVVYFNDPDFWGHDNIIEPTEDLLKGIEKIKKRISRN